MKATLSAKYETDKKSSAAVSFSSTIGNVKLGASVNDFITIDNVPSLSDASFTIEKPGSFSVEYSTKQDIKFQFMNSITVLTKALNITYSHEHPANKTVVDGSMSFDAANKMTVSYTLGTGECKLKYNYVKGEKQKRQVVVEPAYNVTKDAWDIAVTGKFDERNAIKATYVTTSNVLGVDWSRDSKEKDKGSIKVSASIDLTNPKAASKLTAQSTWNYEI